MGHRNCVKFVLLNIQVFWDSVMCCRACSWRCLQGKQHFVFGVKPSKRQEGTITPQLQELHTEGHSATLLSSQSAQQIITLKNLK